MPAGRAWGLYLLGMAVAALPLLGSLDAPYWLNIITLTYLMAALAASWNIIGGFGGQFSLGHGVFFGVGAYLTAIGYVDWKFSPWLMLLPSALAAAILAALLSWPTFRLRGPFFAIATMALNEIAFVLTNYFDSVTGGPRGILIPFRAGFANMIFRERWKSGVLMLVFMALVIAVSLALRRRKLGFYLLALREEEDAARAAGVPVLRSKLAGMALSAALTAMGGGLYAMYLRFIDPPSIFSLLDIGLLFPLLTLIGGIGTLSGPVLGAALIIPLSNYVRGAYGGAWPGTHLVLLGLIMILAALFMKRGIVGVIVAASQRLRGGRP